MNPRTRRALRTLCVLALLLPVAGCSAAGSLDMTAVNDTRLASEASRALPEADDAGAVDRRELVVGAVTNGSATANGTSPPVGTDGLPYAVDGAYYDLSAEPVGNHTAWAVDAKVDYNGSTTGPVVDYGDLPPADRALVDTLLPPRTDRRVPGYEFGAGARYTAAEAAASALRSGEYTAVRYEGKSYPVAVDSERVTVTTYRYTAAEVAPSADAYAASLRESYLFTLPTADLSSAEREVLAGATEATYYAESTDDEAFRSVLGRFRSHEAVRSDEYAGSWVVRYDGTVYWADLRYDGFAGEEDE